MTIDTKDPRQSLVQDDESELDIKPEEPELDLKQTKSISSFFPPKSSGGQRTGTKTSGIVVELPTSSLITPRSYFKPFVDPAPLASEWLAVEELCEVVRGLELEEDSFVEFTLNDFAIYCDTDRYPNEMRPLQLLDTRVGHSTYYFDGVLSRNDSKFFVRRVPIHAVPIAGYGIESVSVGGKVWLQSSHNAAREIYYLLGEPATEYQRFWKPFIWIADLAKHVIDFLDEMDTEKRPVIIQSFRSDFFSWLQQVHGHNAEFKNWKSKHPSNDFGTSVVANIGYIYKEAHAILDTRALDFHPLWSQVLNLDLYKSEPCIENSPTIVTQYIHDCFKDLPFGSRLETSPLSEVTRHLRDQVITRRHLPAPTTLRSSLVSQSSHATGAAMQGKELGGPKLTRIIKAGHTISTSRDNIHIWKKEGWKEVQDLDRWFALVQKVHRDRHGQRTFDVVWYYRPADTLCGLMKYPWTNELFLSDHCSCTEDRKISENEILALHDVEFWGRPTTQKEFFCRQTYMHTERRWVTLKEQHFQCEHVRPYTERKEHQRGETVLVRLDLTSDRSEPCEVISYFKEQQYRKVKLRRLLRRSEIELTAQFAPNELVYTDQLVAVRTPRIQSTCFIRFFHASEDIPVPYSRSGAGNFFFLSHRQAIDPVSGARSCVPLQTAPPTLRQAYDPNQRSAKLRGLDLFCGGGNFGRGLEDGGAVEMRWMNDMNNTAIHTYMANVDDPDSVQPFLGSIDDMQKHAMEGRFSQKVPLVGHVDFISAGSPCPGFSTLTSDKTTSKQRKNQSLVAAFASFVDLYRPKFGLLENVTGIVQKSANRDQDVFSQLVCAIVGMGYQTQIFFLDAHSLGSPQTRARVFLSFAAPGYQLPRKPKLTHAHPDGTKRTGLGRLPHGETMTEREMPESTPFNFISARTGTSDLPAIHDGKPDSCIEFPDHRITMGLTQYVRLCCNLIPTHPYAMSFAHAWYGMDKSTPGSGVMTPSERAVFPQDSGDRTMGRTMRNSNAYKRMHPNKPMNTIVTKPSPDDAKAGQALHWSENRVLTLMEARRAQGFRDEEVILGSPAEQYKMVGNSVAREVAMAIGLMIREAWVGTLLDTQGDLTRIDPKQELLWQPVRRRDNLSEQKEEKLRAKASLDQAYHSESNDKLLGGNRRPVSATAPGKPANSGPSQVSSCTLASTPTEKSDLRSGDDKDRSIREDTKRSAQGASRLNSATSNLPSGSRLRTGRNSARLHTQPLTYNLKLLSDIAHGTLADSVSTRDVSRSQTHRTPKSLRTNKVVRSGQDSSDKIFNSLRKYKLTRRASFYKFTRYRSPPGKQKKRSSLPDGSRLNALQPKQNGGLCSQTLLSQKTVIEERLYHFKAPVRTSSAHEQQTPAEDDEDPTFENPVAHQSKKRRATIASIPGGPVTKVTKYEHKSVSEQIKFGKPRH